MKKKTSSSANDMRSLCLMGSCCVSILLFLPILTFSQAHDSSARKRTLRTVSDVYALSKFEAAKGYPIELEGVVTYSDPGWGVLFLQNQFGPTFIDIHGTSTKYPSGTHIRVEAVTGA